MRSGIGRFLFALLSLLSISAVIALIVLGPEGLQSLQNNVVYFINQKKISNIFKQEGENTLESVAYQMVKNVLKGEKNNKDDSKSTEQEQPTAASSGKAKNNEAQKNTTFDSDVSSTSESSEIESQTTSNSQPPEHKNIEADIVIYGGGLSGTAAAIQAARLGHSVIIVEPTHLLGGQASAAGVSQFDMPPILRDYGLLKEVIDSIKQTYGSSKAFRVGCHWVKSYDESIAAFCPDVKHVHEGLLRLINKENKHSIKIRILYNSIASKLLASRQGIETKVYGVVAYDFKNNIEYTIKAKIVIDASEYGDLIPLLGQKFYVGYPDKPYTSLEQVKKSNACIDKITHSAFIRNKNVYRGKNRYSSKLPRPEGYSLQDSIYFAKFVVPYGQGPKNSDGIDFIDQFIPGVPKPWTFRIHSIYRAVTDEYVSNPDMDHPTYTGLNHANDWPSSGELSVKYLADPIYRHEQNCKAKLLTLKNIYYLTNVYKLKKSGSQYKEVIDPQKIPWYLSKEDPFCLSNTCYSLKVDNCSNIPDEYERYLATIPYVRESFRIYGRATNKGLNNSQDLKNGLLRWQDVDRINASPTLGQKYKIAKNNFKSAVAVADYSFDRHGCKGEGDSNAYKGGWKVGIFQIPIGSFIPSHVRGFIAAEKNLGVDHFVQGGIRVHDSVILSGQVAGFIADELIKNNLEPQRINIAALQERLVNSKVKLSRLIFKDANVNNNFTAWKYAELMNTWEAFYGSYGYFKPNDKISRAQTAVVLLNLAKTLGHPLSEENQNHFADIPSNAYYKKAVNTIFKHGITAGCYYDATTGVRKFCPEKAVTTTELLIFLYKLGQKFNAGNSLPTGCSKINYPADTPSWAKNLLKDIMLSGMFTVNYTSQGCVFKIQQEIGCSNSSCMSKNLTRLQVAKIIWDFIKNNNELKLQQ